ncbi:hypothetical protein GCM10007897_43760 [Sphingobium jiangsuense]|nr:hypothetical protein GCM10007897_43760 [Sphingobium jiangsuense]
MGRARLGMEDTGMMQPILDLSPFLAPTSVQGWCDVLKARSTAARRGVARRTSSQRKEIQ